MTNFNLEVLNLCVCLCGCLLYHIPFKHLYHEPVARGTGRPPPVYLTLNKLLTYLLYIAYTTQGIQQGLNSVSQFLKPIDNFKFLHYKCFIFLQLSFTGNIAEGFPYHTSSRITKIQTKEVSSC